MMSDAMFQLAEDEKIIVEFYSFVSPVKGIYYVEEHEPPVIGLDKSLKSDTSMLRCILAEELGHHFTTVGCCIPREFYNYSDRLHISKVEFKAMRWAAEYLVPENDLLDVIGSGLYEPWELAEHFIITEEFANFRLRLFGVKQHDYVAKNTALFAY
jgi:Zn-dependent peptidase ImmA (M78 family)